MAAITADGVAITNAAGTDMTNTAMTRSMRIVMNHTNPAIIRIVGV